MPYFSVPRYTLLGKRCNDIDLVSFFTLIKHNQNTTSWNQKHVVQENKIALFKNIFVK